MFTEQQLKLLRYCAEEVERQRDTPSAVLNYLHAWLDARSRNQTADLTLTEDRALQTDWIKEWGRLTCPTLNTGWRRVNLTKDWGEKIGVEWGVIPRTMANLVDAYNDGRCMPAQLYYEFEMIHPFKDGNGRVGKILYNWALQSLDDPQLPPKVKEGWSA